MVHAEGNEGVPDKVPVVATNPGQEDLQVVHAERTERAPDKAPVVATNPIQEDRKLVQMAASPAIGLKIRETGRQAGLA